MPTCIQMVMYRRGIPLVPAELIGYHLGLVVPKEELKYFWNGKTGKKPLAGWGTRISKKEYGPNTALNKLGIPLRMEIHLIDGFPILEDFKAYLKEIEEKNKDVLVCFDWGTLFNEDQHTGHVCVLDRVYSERRKVRIIDSEYKAPKWRIVGIKKLYEAMKFHGPKKSGGFWELVVTRK